MVLGWVMAGCDTPPAPPKTADNQVPIALAVTSGNQDEAVVVLAAEKARVNYRYRLTVLADYYRKTGNVDKLHWAEEELANLAQAQTFEWEGVPKVLPPVGESLANADEPLLVEYVVGARHEYQKAMADVQDFYRRTGVNSYKAQRVANAIQRLDPVHMYMYVLQAEIPPADVKPVEVIPQADKMFAQGVDLYREGKGLLHTFITTDYKKERQALLILLDLIQRYPRSTKVAQAAFYIGEIYKEYFNEDVRACQWYERAWQWDPAITLPARFQAAVVNDYRLYNRAKAIELYRQVIQHEQFSSTNVTFAHRRIRELTGS
jgi:hypothetical protein